MCDVFAEEWVGHACVLDKRSQCSYCNSPVIWSVTLTPLAQRYSSFWNLNSDFQSHYTFSFQCCDISVCWAFVVDMWKIHKSSVRSMEVVLQMGLNRNNDCGAQQYTNMCPSFRILCIKIIQSITWYSHSQIQKSLDTELIWMNEAKMSLFMYLLRKWMNNYNSMSSKNRVLN